MSDTHLHCVGKEAYLAQWFWLAGGALFADFSAFRSGRVAGLRLWICDIIVGELGDIGRKNDAPKFVESASLLMRFILIHEAE